MTTLDMIAVPVYHKAFQIFWKVWMVFFKFETIPSWVHICMNCFKFLLSHKTKRSVVSVSTVVELNAAELEQYR